MFGPSLPAGGLARQSGGQAVPPDSPQAAAPRPPRLAARKSARPGPSPESRHAPAEAGRLTGQPNHPSPSSSNQARLPRRRPRPERQFGLVMLRRHALQVRQDLRDDLRLLDAGDDLELAAATGAALDLDAEHALQAPRPVH